jgi:hypothetical protein
MEPSKPGTPPPRSSAGSEWQSPRQPARTTPPAAPPAGPGPSGRQQQRPAEKALLTLEDVAGVLQLPLSEVQQMAQRGLLPGTKATGQWLCPRPMLEKWQQEQELKRRQNAQQRSAMQKMGNLGHAKPMMTSTESYDLSIIDDLDLPDV